MSCTLSNELIKQEWPTWEPAVCRTWWLTPPSTPKPTQLHPSVIPDTKETVARDCPSHHRPSPHLWRWATHAEDQLAHLVPHTKPSLLHQPTKKSLNAAAGNLSSGGRNVLVAKSDNLLATKHLHMYFLLGKLVYLDSWVSPLQLSFHKVLLCKSGKLQDQSCYALASATLRLDSRQERREGRGKKGC